MPSNSQIAHECVADVQINENKNIIKNSNEKLSLAKNENKSGKKKIKKKKLLNASKIAF